MNRGKRLAMVSAFLLIGLVVYAAFPLAAHADDTTPQPPPPTDTTTPVPDGSSGGGSNPADATAVAVQPIAPDLSGSGTSSSGGSTTTTSLTGSDTTGQGSSVVVPAGTSIVPLDSSGNPVPLATATAVAILSTGDPIWCPAGASPSAGSGGCTPSQSNLSNLVGYLSSHQPTGNGTIWITNGIDSSGGTVAINGSTLSTWSTHALTVQGGWDGTTSGSIVGRTTLHANLNISSWANDISLNDLIFDGARPSIDTTGNIHVHDLEVKNSPIDGAILINVSAVDKSITVSDSKFHDNAGTGLSIQANTDASLSNVVASNNLGQGANILTTMGSVSIDESTFNSNHNDGLNVAANTNVDLSKVIADLNNTTAKTQAGTGLLASYGDVSISDSEFSGNQYDGLHALATNGSVNLTNVNADSNNVFAQDLAGAYLSAGDGHVQINGGSFSSNKYDGLEAIASGAITLNNVTANGNDVLGFTHAGSYLSSGPNGNVSISNSSFNDNVDTGLLVQTLGSGSISLSHVSANNNDTSSLNFVGTVLQAGITGNVSINSSAFNDNQYIGLVADAGQSIGLTRVTADRDVNGGAVLNATNGNLSLNDSSFSSSGFDGVIGNAGGQITGTGVNADSNARVGAILNAGGGIFINPNLPSSFSNNELGGLIASTNGNISLAGVTADANNHSASSGPGTLLTSGVGGSISVDDSSFDNNYFDALYAIAGNNVSVTSITADGNQINGGSAQGSTYLSSGGNIHIGNSEFNSNNYDGLHAATFGSITMDGSRAYQNALLGHNLDAGTLLEANGPISISNSSFSNNKWDGLKAQTTNSISLMDVTADSNESSGITNAGTFLIAGGDIAIDPSSFSNNKGDGLIAQAGGQISMAGAQFVNNGSTGAELMAGSDISSHCDRFEGNTGYGASATLPGTLTFNGSFFQGNVVGDFTLSGGGTVAFGGDTCEGKIKYKTPTAPPAYLLGATPAATPAAAAPQLNVLSVTDGQTVNLDCTNYSGTTLALSNRDQIILLCPVTGQATLKHVAVDALPSKLDTTMTYQSGMDAQVTQNGQAATTLNGPMKVDFVIPSSAQGTTQLSILHWDGTQWVDVGGTATPDGFIETITNQTGTFVLVSH